MASPIPYMNAGLRTYDENPIKPYRRFCWELQCVVRGQANPTPIGDGQCIPRVPAIYLFPPHHLHGWTAPVRDVSEIIVFHFAETVDRACAHNPVQDSREVYPAQSMDLLRLRMLYDWIQPHFIDPTVHGAEVLAAGCVFLRSFVEDLRRTDASSKIPADADAKSRVAQARYFFRTNVARNPSVEEIGAMIGLSASQLRRVFAAAGEPPPLQVFRSIQLDYARRLLVGSLDPVSRIAEEVGFGSLSSFTRAFTRHFGHSPIRVRRPSSDGVQNE